MVERFPDADKITYGMLLMREAWMNVSHQRWVSWPDHVRFFMHHPYKAWYIIGVEGEPAGQIYLTDGSKPGYIGNEIGIHMVPRFRRRGLGAQAVARVMAIHGPGKYYANISPFNAVSREFFIQQGFQPLQTTLMLEVFQAC